MKKIFKDYDFGNLLKEIRSETGLTQEKFAGKIGRNRKWIAYKEIEDRKMYIEDFIKIIKTYNFDVTFIYPIDERSIKINDYEPKDFLRILREFTGKIQCEFASDINKTNFWQCLNENGRTRYYANDLFLLAKMNGFQVELSYNGDKYIN